MTIQPKCPRDADTSGGRHRETAPMQNEPTKRCARCGEVRSVRSFTADPRFGDGLRRNCRECNRALSKARYWRATERERREWDLRKTYGIDHAQYDALFESQGGACAICRRSVIGYLSVDHDHVTGRVRGLLCSDCNRGLGLFGDSADLLVHAASYLGGH